MSTPLPTTTKPVELLAPPDILYYEGVQYRVVEVFWLEELGMWVVDTRFTQWNNQAVWVCYTGTMFTVLA